MPLGQAAEQVAVELERRQVACVDADEPRADIGGAVDLIGGVRLDQRRHAELERERVQAAEHILLERRDDQQHEVGAGGACLEHLVLGRDEVLAQHRQLDRGSNGFEVGEAPLEAATLGEHRDRRRAALLVEPGLVCGIGDRGEIAARRARALDLGDDLDAVGGSEGGERIACGGLSERRRARRRRVAARRREPRHPAPRRP